MVVTGVFDGGRDLFWIKSPHPGRRFGHGDGPQRRISRTTRGVGPKRSGAAGRIAHRSRSQSRGFAVRLDPRPLDRRDGDAPEGRSTRRLAHLLRRRHRLGDLHRMGRRTAGVGTRSGPTAEDPTTAGGRPAASASTARRVASRRATGSGRRARERVHPRRGRARPPEGRVGRLHRQRGLSGCHAGDPAALLCTLTVEDPTDSVRPPSLPARWERADPHVDGNSIVDSHGRVSRVTTAGYGPSVGKHILMAYLPPRLAAPGNDLQVMYMNELFPGQGRRHRVGRVRPRRHPPEG